jgi:hypothetical protein
LVIPARKVASSLVEINSDSVVAVRRREHERRVSMLVRPVEFGRRQGVGRRQGGESGEQGTIRTGFGWSCLRCYGGNIGEQV